MTFLALLRKSPIVLIFSVSPASPSADHFRRRVGDREQRARRLVDAGVGRLRRQHDRDEQRERVGVFEFGLRLRQRGGEPLEHRLARARAARGFGGAAGGSAFGICLAPWALIFDELRSRQARSTEAGMDETPSDPEAPIFNARLTPHRSLNRHGISRADGGDVRRQRAVQPAVLSAWAPGRSSAFSGSTSLGVYFAFRANFHAAKAYEHFRLTYFELRFARVSAAGAKREWRFAPAWVRLERVEHEEFGPQRLSLHSRGRRWDIANFLGPDQKAEFAAVQPRARRGAERAAIFLIRSAAEPRRERRD